MTACRLRMLRRVCPREPGCSATGTIRVRSILSSEGRRRRRDCFFIKKRKEEKKKKKGPEIAAHMLGRLIARMCQERLGEEACAAIDSTRTQRADCRPGPRRNDGSGAAPRARPAGRPAADRDRRRSFDERGHHEQMIQFPRQVRRTRSACLLAHTVTRPLCLAERHGAGNTYAHALTGEAWPLAIVAGSATGRRTHRRKGQARPVPVSAVFIATRTGLIRRN